MKNVNINPAMSLSEYRNILVSELESATGEAANPLRRSFITSDEVTVFATIGDSTYKGLFKIWDKTLTVTSV
jgi:hypothetical protein